MELRDLGGSVVMKKDIGCSEHPHSEMRVPVLTFGSFNIENGESVNGNEISWDLWCVVDLE